MKCVVLAGKELDGEATHTTLTCVEGIPNVVHHGVYCVIEACLFVQHENWLDRTIPGIPVKIFKLEEANVSRLANISLLVWSMDAVGVGATNSLVIGDQCKVFRRRRRRDTIIPRIREGNDPVAWCCAREVAAVLHVGPFLGWLGQESKARVISIDNLTVVKEVRRHLVGTRRICVEDDMPFTAS